MGKHGAFSTFLLVSDGFCGSGGAGGSPGTTANGAGTRLATGGELAPLAGVLCCAMGGLAGGHRVNASEGDGAGGCHRSLRLKMPFAVEHRDGDELRFICVSRM